MVASDKNTGKKLNMEIAELKQKLENNFKQIWRCADSNKWHILKDTDLLTFDWIDKGVNYNPLAKNDIGRGKKAIYPFVHTLKVGDLIFVMGKNSFQGIAVCKSEYDYDGPFLNMGESGEKPAIKIQYIFKTENSVKHNLQTHNNPTTFAGINQYNFGLENTLIFLKDDLPMAYSSLIRLVSGKNNNEEDSKLKTSNNISKMPLNQILYGPPGTGKTFHLLENVIPTFKQRSAVKPDEIVESEIISKLPWWKIFALILLENGKQTVPQIKEHRFVKYKLEVSNTNSLNQTVWGQLSSHTINESKTVEYAARQGSLIFDKEEDSVWLIANLNAPVVAELNELLDEIKRLKDSSIETQSNYKFITFHQSTSYENFIEGITPKLDDDNSENIEQLTYEIKKGSFYIACDEAAKLAGFLGLKDCLEHSKEQRIEKFKNASPYCILIDEINRGNVSAIFGELITLIEEDKRLTKNEIIVELPYSKKQFGVPPNLFIIGTMNTADRSVEALDTALRRRFSFTEMPPIYDLHKLNYTFAGTSGKAILKTINNRIEKLLDRDHLIGHYYFLLKDDEKPEEKLVDSFYRNIIPLLQEYFFGDYAKIGAVLGSGFVFAEHSNEQGIFASGFENEDYNEKEIYRIIDFRADQPGNKYVNNGMSFEKAIQLLVNLPIEKEVEV